MPWLYRGKGNRVAGQGRGGGDRAGYGRRRQGKVEWAEAGRRAEPLKNGLADTFSGRAIDFVL